LIVVRVAPTTDAAALGAKTTPTSFINGRMMVGAQHSADIALIIEQELRGGYEDA
jgi:hypothetical protein